MDDAVPHRLGIADVPGHQHNAPRLPRGPARQGTQGLQALVAKSGPIVTRDLPLALPDLPVSGMQDTDGQGNPSKCLAFPSSTGGLRLVGSYRTSHGLRGFVALPSMARPAQAKRPGSHQRLVFLAHDPRPSGPRL